MNVTVSKREIETERQTDRQTGRQIDRGGVKATFRSFPGIASLITYVCIFQIAG